VACATTIAARAAAFSGESPVVSGGGSFNVKEVHDTADTNSVPGGSDDCLATLRVFGIGDAGTTRPAQREGRMSGLMSDLLASGT